MSPTLTTETATWITVRCPCRQMTLVDVAPGSTGEVRRYCHRCKSWRIVNLADGAVRGADPTTEARASA